MPGEVSRSYDPEDVYPEIGDIPLCRGCDASLTVEDVANRGGMCRPCWEEINFDDGADGFDGTCRECGETLHPDDYEAEVCQGCQAKQEID